MLGFIAAPAIVRAASLMPINSKLALLAATIYLTTHYKYKDDGTIVMLFSSSVFDEPERKGWTLMSREVLKPTYENYESKLMITHQLPSMTPISIGYPGPEET